MEYGEFEEWITSSQEIQEFLLMYTGVQTFRCAQIRFDNERQKWADFFERISVNYCGDRYVEMSLLKTELDKQLVGVDDEVK